MASTVSARYAPLLSPGGEIGRHKGLKILSTQNENSDVNGVKFGETLLVQLCTTGNPELSRTPYSFGKCRDLTAPS